MFPFSTARLATTLVACLGLAASAAADLTVLSPGGPDLWWVAQSANTLSWTCNDSPYQNFTILLTNPDPTILSGPIAIIAIEYNYECSKTITQQQAAQPAASGYVLQLANSLNETDVYAYSQPFEIKALGATYPAASATPTAPGASSPSGTSSGSSGSATPSGSGSSSTKSGAVHGVAMAPLAAVGAAMLFGVLVAAF